MSLYSCCRMSHPLPTSDISPQYIDHQLQTAISTKSLLRTSALFYFYLLNCLHLLSAHIINCTAWAQHTTSTSLLFSGIMSQLPNKFHGQFATTLKYVISLTCWSLGCIRLLNHIYLTRYFILAFSFWLIRIVFSNGAMWPMSDKYDSVNECMQEISQLTKLYILWVWQNAYEIY